MSRERGALLNEVHSLREESAELRHQLKLREQQDQQREQQQQQQQQRDHTEQQTGAAPAQLPQQVAGQPAEAAAALTSSQQEQQQRAAAAEVARLQAEVQTMQRQNGELQEQLLHAQKEAAAAALAAAAAETAAAAAGPADDSGPPSQPPTPAAAGPPASAGISWQALQSVEPQSSGAEGMQQQAALPPELAALLPTALYVPAGPLSATDEVVSGTAATQLATSIHLLLDALEAEKRQLLAALSAKQV